MSTEKQMVILVYWFQGIRFLAPSVPGSFKICWITTLLEMTDVQIMFLHTALKLSSLWNFASIWSLFSLVILAMLPPSWRQMSLASLHLTLKLNAWALETSSVNFSPPKRFNIVWCKPKNLMELMKTICSSPSLKMYFFPVKSKLWKVAFEQNTFCCSKPRDSVPPAA